MSETTGSVGPPGSPPRDGDYRSVLVTGAGGYIGRQLVEQLATRPRQVERIVATDVRVPEPGDRLGGVRYEALDVCEKADCLELLHRHGVDLVVHLAAIVTPGRASDRVREWEVDVLGTQNVLEAATASGVRKLIYTSSGAAYGYHADNPEWIDESAPLRGNPDFAYSDHKRQVEERLAAWRERHPELLQLVFRPGTILGARTRNQITALFEGRVVLGVAGAATPFVFVWDQDVVGAIAKGIHEGGTGVYNLAGDGTLAMREIARLLGKPYVPIPPAALRAGLWALKRLGLSQYGPEQLGFLRYRPVLANRRLREEFGYVPQKTTRETFETFLAARRLGAERRSLVAG